MPIYTRAGDGGFTQLPRKGAEPLRLPKDDPRIVALGELDGFNAHVGWCLAACVAGRNDLVRAALAPVQADLFRIGASLASLAGGGEAPVRIELTEVAELERTIDRIFAGLGPLTHFILPGGSELAARLHVTRTVCRRAERAVVAALHELAARGAVVVGSARQVGSAGSSAAAAAQAEGSADVPTGSACPSAEPFATYAKEPADPTGKPADASELILRYLNRLSDLLFALARQANGDDGTPERVWRP